MSSSSIPDGPYFEDRRLGLKIEVDGAPRCFAEESWPFNMIFLKFVYALNMTG
jgi:hypothetical protein